MSATTEKLAAVQSEISAAEATLLDLQTRWDSSSSSGMLGMCEPLEDAIADSKRQLVRLNAQAAHLQTLVTAEQANEAVIDRQNLTTIADACLVGVVTTLSEMVPLVTRLAELTDTLQNQGVQWKEKVHFASAAGAPVEGFCTQENDATVKTLVDSLARTRLTIAGTATDLSRFGLRVAVAKAA